MALTVDPNFGHWLAGFIAGEGSFNIHHEKRQDTFSMRFAVGLHVGDRAILDEIVAQTGIGVVREYHYERRSEARWLTRNKADCIALVELLDAYPLRAKKAQDFAVWRRAVQEWSLVHNGGRPGRGRAGNWEKIRPLRDQLHLRRPHSEDSSFEEWR